MEAHPFLLNLAIVLCVAAVTTLVFQRLRQPVLFGYLVAGMLIGPHIPFPLVADLAVVREISELGVTLLMFSIGLEFSVRGLFQVGGSSALAALAETSVMMGLGYLAGRLLGWTEIESLVGGAVVAISSTTIIAKALAERPMREPYTGIVFGILIVEDLIAVILVATLTAVTRGDGVTPREVGVTLASLAWFLALLVGVGLLVVPPLVRAVVRLNRPETTVITSVGLCFAAALLAYRFGYSVALGAFIAGSLVAESGHARDVELVVRPVRDVFVAIFFVAVGMLIDPALVAAHWVAVLLFTVVVIAGKVLAVSAGVFLTGRGLRPAVQTGMTLAQIGEFSFIIVGVGLASGRTRDFLYPVAVAVSALTTLATPWLIRAAGPVSSFVDHHLPRPLQTFAALYGSWLEALRTATRDTDRASVKRLVRLLLLDALVLAMVAIGLSTGRDRLATLLQDIVPIDDRWAMRIVVVFGLVIAAPLVVGLVRTSGRLGRVLAARALPAALQGRVDFADAPRRALVNTLQLAILFAVGAPLVAVTQPFLPSVPGVGLLLLVGAVLSVAFWRSARDLEGHALAGAEVMVMALAPSASNRGRASALDDTMRRVRAALPGLGEPVPIRVHAGTAGDGATLAGLDLRALSGATVLAIVHENERILVPTGQTSITAGDVLIVAGTHEAVDTARMIVDAAPVPPSGGTEMDTGATETSATPPGS